MKIAQVAPLYEAVPPRLYGGTERIVAHLTSPGRAGPRVTLFASGEARTRARLVRFESGHRLTRAPYIGPRRPSVHAAGGALRERVRHHSLPRRHDPLSVVRAAARKTLTTLHGRLDLKDLPGVYQRWPQYPLVSIATTRGSVAVRQLGRTIHHGLPDDLWRDEQAQGRLSGVPRPDLAEKRPDRAIAIAGARALSKIAAKVDGTTRPTSRTRSRLIGHPRVEFIGEINDAKPAFLGATALLFPIDWPEPFGLVMIEAMAAAPR